MLSGIERTNLTLAVSVLDETGRLCACGWVQERAARSDECLTGAFWRSMHRVVGIDSSWQRYDAVCAAAEAALNSAILATYPAGIDLEDTDDRMLQWNDEQGRTQEEVVAVCYRASGMLMSRIGLLGGIREGN